MLRVVAGFLLEPDLAGRGPGNKEKWKEVVDELDLLLVDDPDQQFEGYNAPMKAYELSIKSMGTKEKQLLAVLRHFPPIKEVAIAVVQAVWEGFSCSGADYKSAMKKLIRMNVVDRHQREHYLSLIHISEPTRRYAISYAVFCLKKKKL